MSKEGCKTPYEVLGVNSNATAAEIEKAHRKAAQKHHPDKGGSIGTFLVVQKAYKTLSDDARRKHYDETGEEDDGQEQGTDGRIKSEVASLIFQVLQAVDEQEIIHTDIIEHVSTAISKGIVKCENDIASAQELVRKLTKVAKRFKTKKKKRVNLIRVFIEGRTKEIDRNCDAIQKKIDFNKRMLVFLEDYEFEVEIMQQIQHMDLGASQFSTTAY